MFNLKLLILFSLLCVVTNSKPDLTKMCSRKGSQKILDENFMIASGYPEFKYPVTQEEFDSYDL